MRLIVLAVAVCLLALAGAAWWARTHSFAVAYVVETRRFMVAMKTGGHASGVSWLSLVRRLGPRWMQRDEPTFVRALPDAPGPGPCPGRWETPLGLFHGGRDDGAALDHLVVEELGGHIYDRAPADIRRGDVVIDVGAHLGTFTRYALRKGASRVIAIEPMPTLVDCLERTFQDEIAAGSVTIVEVAAWHENTQLEFAVGPQSTTGRVGNGALRVTGETLDSIAARLGLARVDFIKMDIEGAEPQALAGAAGVMATHYPRMAICIYHGKHDAETVSARVMRAGPRYREFRRGPFQAYFHR